MSPRSSTDSWNAGVSTKASSATRLPPLVTARVAAACSASARVTIKADA